MKLSKLSFALTIATAMLHEAPLVSSKNNQHISDNYIVVLKEQLHTAQVEQHHDWIESLAKKSNGKIKHKYNFVKGYAGQFDEATLAQIRASSLVDYIEKDQIVQAYDVQNDAPWGLSRISHREIPTVKYEEYPYNHKAGEGVTTYVVDTGINILHEDFEGRASWGATIPDGDEDVDGNGHGTHVAGTMVGKKYGVAKKATVKAVKVLRSNGSGSMSDVLKGVEWVIKDHQERVKGNGGKSVKSVANMSLGGGRSRSLDAAVNAAVESGVHFAVAAGNDARDACDYSPAAAKKAITVGASTKQDFVAWFSNTGNCVDVFAPGKDITSTWIGSNSATNTISGTSMASPHVAGLVALMIGSIDDPISPKKFKKLLKTTSTKDALRFMPRDTVNLLVFSNPPEDNEDEENVELKRAMKRVMKKFLDEDL